jgi:hypothetical protein
VSVFVSAFVFVSVFVVAQAMYLSRHIIADEATPDKTSEELQ